MKPLERALGMGAALSLFAMMLLTFCDVVGRKFLGESIVGSLELTELLMLGAIFFALPLASLKGEHVVFDLLDVFLPPPIRKLQGIISNVFCALLMAGAAWLVWLRALRIMEDGDQTAQLAIELAPFVVLTALLLLATAIMHLVLAVTDHRVPHSHLPGVEEQGDAQ